MPTYALTFESQQWRYVAVAEELWTEMDTQPLIDLLRAWKLKFPALKQLKVTRPGPPEEWTYVWKIGPQKWKQTLRLVAGEWEMDFACDFFKERDFVPQREVRAELQRLLAKFRVESFTCDWS